MANAGIRQDQYMRIEVARELQDVTFMMALRTGRRYFKFQSSLQSWNVTK